MRRSFVAASICVLLARINLEAERYVVRNAKGRIRSGDVNRVVPNRQWMDQHANAYRNGRIHCGSVRNARFAHETRVIGQDIVLGRHGVAARLVRADVRRAASLKAVTSRSAFSFIDWRLR